MGTWIFKHPQGLQHASFSVSLCEAVVWACCWVTRSHFLLLDLDSRSKCSLKLMLLAVWREFSPVLMVLKRMDLQIWGQYLKELVKIIINCFEPHRNRGQERTRPDWSEMVKHVVILCSKSYHAAFPLLSLCSFILLLSYSSVTEHFYSLLWHVVLFLPRPLYCHYIQLLECG